MKCTYFKKWQQWNLNFKHWASVFTFHIIWYLLYLKGKYLLQLIYGWIVYERDKCCSFTVLMPQPESLKCWSQAVINCIANIPLLGEKNTCYHNCLKSYIKDVRALNRLIFVKCISQNFKHLYETRSNAVDQLTFKRIKHIYKCTSM